MKRNLMATAAALILSAGIAAAALSPEAVVADWQAMGFSRIEVKVGPTQIKVEAIRGTEKVETIYDIATGAILKQEVEAVRAGEDTAPGVEIRRRDRDFSGDGRGRDRAEDDDDDDDDRDRAEDDDDDDRGRGRGRGGDDDRAGDDDDGHDGGRGRGRGRGRGGDG